MTFSHEWLKSEFSKVTNKLKKRFLLDNFSIDAESKAIYDDFRKGKISNILVILPSGAKFIYSSMEEFEQGLGVIFDMLDYNSKLVFKNVKDVKVQIEKIVDDMFENLN